jgi:hypothetical protein
MSVRSAAAISEVLIDVNYLYTPAKVIVADQVRLGALSAALPCSQACGRRLSATARVSGGMHSRFAASGFRAPARHAVEARASLRTSIDIERCHG